MTPTMNGTGVYYMSGWAVDPNLIDHNGVPRPTGWHLLESWNNTPFGMQTAPQYNDREPHWLTGFYDGSPHIYYDNSRQEALDNNILGMYDAKFQFVTFQTGWTRSQDTVGIGVPFWTHAISRYMTSQYKGLLQWALLYDEEDNAHHNLNRWWNRWQAGWRSADYRADFAAMVAYWRDNFVQDPQFLRIDGKPVIYILADIQSPHDSVFYRDPSLHTNATAMVTLLRQTMAQAAGLQVYLVGFADPNANLARVDSLKMWGFDAVTGYQYRGPNINYFNDAQAWANKDALYRNAWTTVKNRATTNGLSYFPPTTVGFDNRDLNQAGGFSEGVFEARANVTQYQAHVAAVKAFVNSNQSLTRGIAMNCCWNEWTEGAYLDRASDISSSRGTDRADAHRRAYTTNPPANRGPIGWIDGIVDGHYTLSGWAFDEDAPSQGVSLDVYFDGCNPSVLGGGTIYYHAYVNSTYNTVGNHGFRIPVPPNCRDGQPRTVRVYAFDTAGDPSKVSLIGQGNYTYIAYP